MNKDISFRWMYIDFNSYFASVEQQLDPSLRGKPIVVIPVDSDTTSAIAASYEAKAFGIKTGTPIYEAKRLCRNLICVVAKHDAYVTFHERILEVVGECIPISRVASIDEMACELMDNESSVESATKLSRKIKENLKRKMGECIRCSIGIAPNSYLAKVATDMQKPDGLVFIAKSDLPHKLHSLKLRDLPGIGAHMEVRIKRQGILDMKTFCSLSKEQMRKVWGSVLGERMWMHLQGIELPEMPTQRRSLGHSHVLAPELRIPSEAKMVAHRLGLKCAARLRRMGFVSSSISLKVMTEEGLYLETGRRCFQAQDSMTITGLVKEMWKEIVQESEKIKKIGVTLSSLQEIGEIHPDLFEKEEDVTLRKKKEKASFALDKINHRYGKDSILLGIVPGKKYTDTKIAFTRIPDSEEFLE